MAFTLSSFISSTYQGAQGIQGIQGVQGIQGTQGIIGPTASVPDQAIILNDISTLFNGSTTQFILSDSSGNFINSEIDSEARLLVSVGGIVQQPNPSQTSGFYISGGSDRTTDPIKINFVEAPRSGQVFFGVVIKSTNSPTTPFTTAEQSIAYSIAFGA